MCGAAFDDRILGARSVVVNYHWNWHNLLGAGSQRGPAPISTMLLSGLVLTIETALCAWILALVFGAIVGVLRTLPSTAASVVRLRLCRVLPQHAALGAIVSLVFRVAGIAAAIVGACG